MPSWTLKILFVTTCGDSGTWSKNLNCQLKNVCVPPVSASCSTERREKWRRDGEQHRFLWGLPWSFFVWLLWSLSLVLRPKGGPIVSMLQRSLSQTFVFRYTWSTSSDSGRMTFATRIGLTTDSAPGPRPSLASIISVRTVTSVASSGHYHAEVGLTISFANFQFHEKVTKCTIL